VRLEFLANSRRHEVPGNWVVGAEPVPSAGLLGSGISPQRLERGKLAITLLRTERAILGVYVDALSKSADTIEELQRLLKQYTGANDKANIEKCNASMQSFLARELMELDEETASLQPQSLDQMPPLKGPDGEDVGQRDLNKPIWNMPPVGPSAFSPEVVEVDVRTDADGRPEANFDEEEEGSEGAPQQAVGAATRRDQ